MPKKVAKSLIIVVKKAENNKKSFVILTGFMKNFLFEGCQKILKNDMLHLTWEHHSLCKTKARFSSKGFFDSETF